MKLLKMIVLGIAVSALLVTAQVVSAEPEITLNLGTVAREGTSLGDGIAQVLIPKAAEYSNGRLKIVAHWSGSLCGEHICGEQMRLGLVDIGTVSTANFGNFGTSYAIFDLPYLFKDLDSANSLAAGWLGKTIAENARKETGFKIFGLISGGGFRTIGNAVRPVKVPADLKGLKLRVTKSPVEFSLIKSWGGVPIPYQWGQLYQGIQTGVVDGQYVALPWQNLAKMYEVQKHYTLAGGSWHANVIFMDEKRLNGLPDWAREALEKAMAEAVPAAVAADVAWIAEGEANIKSKVKTFYTPNANEQAKWVADSVGAWTAGAGTYDKNLAKKALKEQGMTDLIERLTSIGAL